MLIRVEVEPEPPASTTFIEVKGGSGGASVHTSHMFLDVSVPDNYDVYVRAECYPLYCKRSSHITAGAARGTKRVRFKMVHVSALR